MNNDIEKIKNLRDAVVLDSVLLKSSNSDIVVPPEIITKDIARLNIDYSFNHTYEAEAKILFSFVAVNVDGILSDEAKKMNPALVLEADRLFSSSCIFVARYHVNSELVVGEEDCKAFTRTNALFNVYPYLREQISSELSKMGLHGIYLPLLKPSVKK